MTVFNPSSHKFAIACGAGGAFVEVTSSVVFNEGAGVRSWGRQDAFSDASPSTFAFTLDNRDGKFTPGNATGISPVVLTLAKGMGVSWELNGQVRSGRIRSVVPVFPSEGKPDAARVRVTVDDVLAIAARTTVDSLAQQLVRGASPYLHWPLDEAAGSTRAAEKSGNGGPDLAGERPVSFGVAGVPAVGSTQVEIFTAPSAITYPQALNDSGAFPAVAYAANSAGVWSWWVTASQPECQVAEVRVGQTLTGFSVTTVGGYYNLADSNRLNPVSSGVPVVAGVPVYLSVSTTAVFSGTWTATNTLSINGVAVASRSYTVAGFADVNKQPSSIRLGGSQDSVPTWARFSNLSHTPVAVDEYKLVSSTAGERLTLLSGMVPQLVLDTLPADLTTARLGIQGSGSVLDLMNEVIRGEQGHIYSVTSGTLLAPVEKVRVRSRTRPEAVTATFDVAADIIGAPELGYETTNTVSSATATGPDAKASAFNPALVPVVGTANTSTNLALEDVIDLRGFAEDRILRGITAGVDVFSITVNTRSTNSSRWADVLALTPGLRYRVTGLPVTQLGFAQWDGWFLGATEVHDQENNLFTLHFERTLPTTGILDTDRFMSGGETTLFASINAAVTSMSVTTTGARMSTTETPYKLIIDSEIVNVTAASGATPQVLTIQRAQNGTTAATHAAGAVIESFPDSLFAY